MQECKLLPLLKNMRRGQAFVIFKAILVDGDSYLLELVRYINLDQVRAGLALGPEESDWSGHNNYSGEGINDWLHTDWVLSQFGKQLNRARRNYAAFVVEGIDQEDVQLFQQGSAEGRLLGDDHFIDRALAKGKQSRSKVIPLKHIIEITCQVYQRDIAVLYSKGRSREATKLRTIIAYIAIENGGLILTDVAR